MSSPILAPAESAVENQPSVAVPRAGAPTPDRANEIRRPRLQVVGGGSAPTGRSRRVGRDATRETFGPAHDAPISVEQSVDMVRSSILFSALDHEAAADLRRCMVEVRLRRGQVLFRQGEVGDRLYVIADGKVKLGRVASDGRESLLSLLGPGDMFGELSLFDPGPRTATAAVVTDAQVCALERRALEPLLWQRPDLALCLLGRLSRRVRRSAEAQTDLVFHDTPGRVAKTLVDLSARFGTPCDVGLHLRHDLTQEELAQLVGASRETVNKVLADFSDRGWIRTAARAVVLVDIERLRQRAR